jgi:hypothetical protein
VADKTQEGESAKHIVALPLGGRIKLNPWDDTLVLLKTRSTGKVLDREKMAFEITPFEIYLTRSSAEPPSTSELNVVSLRP